MPNLHPSFNTQPPEGGWKPTDSSAFRYQRFNTQPPEGGWAILKREMYQMTGFNTQPPEGGWNDKKERCNDTRKFQHTAA